MPRDDAPEQAVCEGTVRADADLETTVALIIGGEPCAHLLAERVVDALWFGLKGGGRQDGA